MKCCPVSSTSCDLCTCKIWSWYVQWFRSRYIYMYKKNSTWAWHRDQAQYLLHHLTYAPAKFEDITSNHLQENTFFSLDLGPKAHGMLPNILYIMWPMQLQFEATMHNGLGDEFTNKYIGSLILTLGHTKCCGVPSTSCDLFRCYV